MPRDFFDPPPEQQNVVLVDAATLRKAERLIVCCEHCNGEDAQIPFDNILDRLTCSDPSVTDYILEEPAKCPNCRRDILEKSLVEPASRMGSMHLIAQETHLRCVGVHQAKKKGHTAPGHTTMKRLMTTVFFGLLLTGCELPPTTAPASPSTEPFQIKTNDTLGIRLGMPWAEFIKKQSSRAYLCMPDERARFCTVVADEAVMVGEERVKLWSVRFYQERLIGIDYPLTVLDPFVLLNGFQEKFGLPTQSSPRSCDRTCARTWKECHLLNGTYD